MKCEKSICQCKKQIPIKISLNQLLCFTETSVAYNPDSTLGQMINLIKSSGYGYCHFNSDQAEISTCLVDQVLFWLDDKTQDFLVSWYVLNWEMRSKNTCRGIIIILIKQPIYIMVTMGYINRNTHVLPNISRYLRKQR